MVDLVPNHSSDRHEWFRTALAGGPDAPERALYHFRDGAGPDGAEPPNDWRSMFGGSAWEPVADVGPDGEPLTGPGAPRFCSFSSSSTRLCALCGQKCLCRDIQ